MGGKRETESGSQSDTLVNPVPISESNTNTSTGRAEDEVQIVDEQDEYSVENLRRRQSQEPLDTSFPVSNSARVVEEPSDDPKLHTSLSLPLHGSRKLRPYYCLSFDAFSKLSLSPNDHAPLESSSEGLCSDSPRNPRDISFRDFAESSRYSPNQDSSDYENSLGDSGNRGRVDGGWTEGWLKGWTTVNGTHELEASGSSEKDTSGTGTSSPTSSSVLSFLKWEEEPSPQTPASASAGSPSQLTTSKGTTRSSKSVSSWFVTTAAAATAVTAVKTATTDVSAPSGGHDPGQGHSHNFGESPSTSKGKKSKGITKQCKRRKRKSKN